MMANTREHSYTVVLNQTLSLIRSLTHSDLRSLCSLDLSRLKIKFSSVWTVEEVVTGSRKYKKQEEEEASKES